MIEKKEVVDKITLFPETGVVQIRKRTLVVEDDVVLASSNHSTTVEPDRPLPSYVPEEEVPVLSNFRTEARINKRKAQRVKMEQERASKRGPKV